MKVWVYGLIVAVEIGESCVDWLRTTAFYAYVSAWQWREEKVEENEPYDFFETIFRLDACDDMHEFLEFVQGRRHSTSDMLSATAQLLARGRIRSAYIMAMLLEKRGQRTIVMSIALSVGGLIFGNTVEEENGLRFLAAQVESLAPERLLEVYDRMVAPLVSHLWAASVAKQDAERVWRFLRHFQGAVTEGFDWTPQLCKLCAGKAEYWFHARLCGRYRVAYYWCTQCEFLCTEAPYWQTEEGGETLLQSSSLASVRQTWGRRRAFVSLLLLNLYDAQRECLDCSADEGRFARSMREAGFHFRHQGPQAVARAAERLSRRSKTEAGFELVTAFDVWQRFAEPGKVLDRLLANSDGILFNVPLLPDPIPKPEEWSGYDLGGGRNLAFFAPRTLRRLAERRQLYWLSNGEELHLFTRREISGEVFEGMARWVS
ncbi:methyltransferase domain-containing protein [Candidatus Magnetaquicoccus inordinatus]|uniref:methyltransferase domain-containing protein n=1 Tax=Candidatus Magnetaquicoccus inordinatus TaxID=2496818 RepID=UPI00102BFB8F|nr:methyltransferase domain-containing protein [Candidatus Magnetaquicoccus inordinatus]